MSDNSEAWGVNAVKASLGTKGLIRHVPMMRSTGFNETVQLVSVERGKLVVSWFADPKFEGFDGVANGGIQVAVADIAQGMCFTSLLDGPKGFSTVDLSTRFLRHLHVNETYQLISEVAEESRNAAIIESRIIGKDGKTRTYFTGSWKVHQRAFKVSDEAS